MTLPLAALLFDWALTALWPVVGQAGIRSFTGVLFAQGGLLIGFAALFPWLLKEERLRRILGPELRGRLFWVGFLGSGLPSFLFLTALEHTSAANAAILAQVEVLYSAVLCTWLLGEKIGPSQGAGSLLVLAGTGLVAAHDFQSGHWKGDLLILATPWMFQLSHILAKRLPKEMDAVSIAGSRMLYGGLSLAPISAWALWQGARWTWAPGPLALLAFQGLGMYALNHILWYVAIRGMDLAKASAIMLSYPALSVLFAWALAGEPVSSLQLVGLALSLSGAYWLSWMVTRAAREEGAGPRAGAELGRLETGVGG